MHCALEALLALLCLHGDEPETTSRLEQWCSSRIRKVVKRAHDAKWRKLCRSMENSEIPCVLIKDLDSPAAAAAFAPMRVSAQPKVLKNLQVSGLELEVSGNEQKEPVPGMMEIIVDKNLGLTSGKAIAQAGHAMQLALRYMDDDSFKRWMEMGYAFDVKREVILPNKQYDAVVTDAGFTEIAPGTKTAAAKVL